MNILFLLILHPCSNFLQLFNPGMWKQFLSNRPSACSSISMTFLLNQFLQIQIRHPLTFLILQLSASFFNASTAHYTGHRIRFQVSKTSIPISTNCIVIYTQLFKWRRHVCLFDQNRFALQIVFVIGGTCFTQTLKFFNYFRS